MNLDRHIVSSTLDVFETMILLKATPQTVRWESTDRFENHVTSMLGFSGDLAGMLYLHCPETAAYTLTAALLGDDNPLPEDIRDALGEVANMIAGGLKSSLAALGTLLEISIPTAISGSSYSINTLSGAQGVGVPFTLADTGFLVEIRYLANL